MRNERKKKNVYLKLGKIHFLEQHLRPLRIQPSWYETYTKLLQTVNPKRKKKKRKKQNRIEKSRREAKAVRAAPGAEEEMESRGGKEEEGRGRRQQPNRGREKAAPRREAMALVPETWEKDETPLLVGWELGRLI